MKVRLIQPAQLDASGQPIKYKKVFLPFITLATLAGLTPEGIDVSITDEFVDNVDYDEDVDLVGVTAQTCQAPRAYQICDEFRKRGKQTIMGGIHASMCTEEALAHCDSVLVGEAEDLWETVLSDARSHRLKRLYKADNRPSLDRLVIPRFDLFNFDNYVVPPFAKTPLIPIQATRGCPHNCSFCSVSSFVGNAIRKKPVPNVLQEIERIQPSRVFFTDDNIIADPSYSRDLFIALKSLRMRWACQTSTRVIKHPELIELAAESGCHETFIGIESLNEEVLRSVSKGFNKVGEYRDIFRRLKDVGILAQASIIFGFDGDTKENLERVIETVLEWDINYLYIQILVPLPGTPLFEQLEQDKRITDTNWSLYDGTSVVIDLESIRPDDLWDVIWRSYGRFYSLSNILRRVWRFRREYTRFFPRDFMPEEVFFQLGMRGAIRRMYHPFSLGLRKNGAS